MENLNENLNETTEQSEEKIEKDFTELESKLKEADAKYIRLYADFDNYKRRNQTEYSNILKTASKEVIVSMIPILDDFERALKNNVGDGIELIYNKMVSSLASKGLASYNSLGEEFNPDLHECITHLPSTPEMSNKVIEEVEKGYTLNGVILRYSKVVVGA